MIQELGAVHPLDPGILYGLFLLLSATVPDGADDPGAGDHRPGATSPAEAARWDAETLTVPNNQMVSKSPSRNRKSYRPQGVQHQLRHLPCRGITKTNHKLV